MNEQYENFCEYLSLNNNISKNTLSSYKRDIKQFLSFLQAKKIKSVKKVNNTTIENYFKYLEKDGKSNSTIARNLSSIRFYFKYLVETKVIAINPTIGLTYKQSAKKMPEIMTNDEIDLLMVQPDVSTNKGLRDKAMLEVLYATGMRVSELISLKVDDLNLDIGCINVYSPEQKKERVVPLYNLAIMSVKNYLTKARATFTNDKNNDILFLNVKGQPMSRQGFWKLIKQYTKQAKIEKDITPKTLRHSFATHLLENGADLVSIKDMLGHSALSSTKVYAKMLKTKYVKVYEHCHPRARSK